MAEGTTASHGRIVSTALLWEVIGSAAAVVGVPVAVILGVLQLRQPGKVEGRSGRPADEPLRRGARADLALPAPLGRLPTQVRGRVGLITMLVRLAGRPDGQVHVLAGLGGCGKSAIALDLARRLRDGAGPVCLWWIPAVDSASVTGLLLGLARVAPLDASRLGGGNKPRAR